MDSNTHTYTDFIPEGEDQGAYVDGKFQDFVPAPLPQPQILEHPTIDAPAEIVTPVITKGGK